MIRRNWLIYFYMVLVSPYIICMELANTSRLTRPEIRRYEVVPDITESYPNAINIASYNILSEFLNRNLPYSWDNRKPLVIKALSSSGLHIIGLQEVNLIQLKALREAMSSQFAFVAYVSRLDKNVDEILPGEIYDELVTIAFDKTRFEMKTSGRFWLSSTPEILSTGWDASRPRILMFVILLDRQTNKEFVVFNTHYDHSGREALIQSGRLEASLIKKVAGNLPWFAVGDFNSFTYSKSLGAEWSSKQWYAEFITPEGVSDFRDGTEMGHFGESTTFVGFENDNAKTLLKEGVFDTEVMDLGFYNKLNIKALMSYCWSFEYEINDAEEAVLLPIGMPIKNPEKRQFASDHFLFGGWFILP